MKENINTSKNNSRTYNISNIINSSNYLTANYFYKRNEEKILSLKKNKEKSWEKEKEKSFEEEKEKKKMMTANKSTGCYSIEMNINNIFMDKTYFNKTGMKEPKKKLDNEILFYQDFLIDGYKNPYSNDRKNLIEKLGDCFTQKQKTFENKKFAKQCNRSYVIPKKKIFKECQKYQKMMLGKTFFSVPKSITTYSDRHSTRFIKIKNSNSKSHILEKKFFGDFPLLLNTPNSYRKKFSSFSEKERNKKNLLALIKLKHFLKLYWSKRIEIIKEFFDKCNINEPYLYQEENLENFANYINDNIINNENNFCENNGNIETRIPMIDIIKQGIKYKSNINYIQDYFKIMNDKKTRILKKMIKHKIQYPRKCLNKSLDELSLEKEYNEYINEKGKLEKYRNFLNRNYKRAVMNQILKGLSKEEKIKYFGERRYGIVEIKDKNNLANSLEKQALYIKRYNQKANTSFNKTSIKFFNDDDLKRLNDELNHVSYSIIKQMDNDDTKKNQENTLGKQRYNDLTDRAIDKLNQRFYYTIKQKYHKIHPEIIPTQKKKLLEYIIVQKIKEQNNFEGKLLKDLNKS